MTFIRMGDAVTPRMLPGGLDAYAGYIDGHYADFLSIVTDHEGGGVRFLSIAAFPQQAADCLDVEKGDAVNVDVGPWIRLWRKGNTVKPVIYTSASNGGPMIQAAGDSGVSRHEFFFWCAHFTGVPHVCRSATCWPESAITWSADGTQWTDHGDAWDESLMSDALWSGAPSQRQPNSQGAEDMDYLVTFIGKSDLHITGGRAVVIDTQADLEVIVAKLALPIVPLATVAQWENYAKLGPPA